MPVDDQTSQELSTSETSPPTDVSLKQLQCALPQHILRSMFPAGYLWKDIEHFNDHINLEPSFVFPSSPETPLSDVKPLSELAPTSWIRLH